MILDVVEKGLDFRFDYCLSLADQVTSEDKDFYVKNIEILTGKGGRQEAEILLIDT